MRDLEEFDMAKMSTEERHNKQKEKLMGQTQEIDRPIQKSQKDKVIDELEKLGYHCEMVSGIPMYHVEKKKDAMIIHEKFEHVGSFGITYARKGELADGIDWDKNDEE